MKKFKLNIFILLLFTSALWAQSDLHIAQIGNFKLTNGDTIYNCKIGYRLFGNMNSAKSNIILFPTWFGGTTEGLKGLIGSNKVIDSDKYYVIAVDALGDGVSSSPSNSGMQPDLSFPVFSIEDMVNSQYKLLTEELKINHIYAVFGGSMGGMQTFQWMVSYPKFMDKALPYVGSPKLTSYDLLLWNTELHMIELGHKCNLSDDEIIKNVAELQTLEIQTPEYRVEHTTPEEYDSFIRDRYKTYRAHFNSYDYASQLRAMLQQNISKNFKDSMELAAKNVKAKVFIIVSQTDHMVNPNPALNFAKLINAETYIFQNNCGHLGPGCDMEKFTRIVHGFLNK